MSGAISALFIDKFEKSFSVGFASVEEAGLKVRVCEIEADGSHPFGSIDRALHLISVSGTEYLLIAISDPKNGDDISPYFNHLQCRYVNDMQISTADKTEILGELFSLSTLLTPIEHLSLENRKLSLKALMILAEELLGRGISGLPYPEFLDTKQFCLLENNALSQLEILSSSVDTLQVGSYLLNMATPMGRRLGRFRLGLPIVDESELNKRYDWIEAVVSHNMWLNEKLSMIGDIEQMWRKTVYVQSPPPEEITRQCSVILDIIAYCERHKIKCPLPDKQYLEQFCIEFPMRYGQKSWLLSVSPALYRYIEWIAQLDIAVTSARNAQKYGFCRPVIVDAAGENFLQLTQIRHFLIEMQGVNYIPNDIVMGNRDYLDIPFPETVMLDPHVHDGSLIRGMLLYGINSSGKSSLMKSIGIASVLAQAGFFVPAKAMKFALFDGIYTRIQSRDNIAKSLSTFGVEMLELNTIFSRATSKSLILGDEISHGTETLSAVSIVASTIMELTRKNSLFILTTHLHQLSQVNELTKLKSVVNLHLSVRYDQYSDRLIYDRILKPGRGSSVYGLEFAESLHMYPPFLENAKKLREKLTKEYDVLELSHQKEYIKRYREVVACECIICGALVRSVSPRTPTGEHHHLIPLCEKHTRMFNEGKIKLRGFIMTSQGLRLEYDTQL